MKSPCAPLCTKKAASKFCPNVQKSDTALSATVKISTARAEILQMSKLPVNSLFIT